MDNIWCHILALIFSWQSKSIIGIKPINMPVDQVYCWQTLQSMLPMVKYIGYAAVSPWYWMKTILFIIIIKGIIIAVMDSCSWVFHYQFPVFILL